MSKTMREKHQDCLRSVELLFGGMRKLLVGQESALSRLILAALSARPLTVQRPDGTEVQVDPSSIAGCAHIRMLGSPGVGKTHLASALSLMINCLFEKVDCTSDKQPTDFIGGSISVEGHWDFLRGPLLKNHVILADEITNCTPKSQRALLAGLSDDFVSVSLVSDSPEVSKTRERLLVPFFFMATQNPKFEVGTYAMPLALLDRFAMTLRFRHLNVSERMQLQKRNEVLGEQNIPSVIDRQTFISIREFIFTEIKVPEETAYLISVLTRLLDPSAEDENDPGFRRLYDELWDQCFDEVKEKGRRYITPVQSGAVSGSRTYRLAELISDSMIERAVLFLRYLGKALAFTKTDKHDGMREVVIPSDIFKIFPDVMFHRMGLTNVGERLGEDMVIDSILKFLVSKVRSADWFFADLSRAAKEARGRIIE